MGCLDGKVAIVTGAARGIGAAVSARLAAEGAAVVVNDVGTSLQGSGTNQTPAEEQVGAIQAAGGRAVANYADVGDFDAASGLVDQAVDEFGRLDILVNVAGILRDRMVFNMSEEEWDAVIRVHLRGTFNTTRHAASYWREHRGGPYRLINFASLAALFGGPGQPNYAAAKMGIVGFTYSCANALSRYGVTSNVVCPTAQTRLTDAASDTLIDSLIDETQTPENLTPAIIYLATDRSSWINGRIIGARGNKIGLYSNPHLEREIMSAEPWELEAAFSAIEKVFRPAIENRNMFDALVNSQSTN